MEAYIHCDCDKSWKGLCLPFSQLQWISGNTHDNPHSTYLGSEFRPHPFEFYRNTGTCI